MYQGLLPLRSHIFLCSMSFVFFECLWTWVRGHMEILHRNEPGQSAFLARNKNWVTKKQWHIFCYPHGLVRQRTLNLSITQFNYWGKAQGKQNWQQSTRQTHNNLCCVFSSMGDKIFKEYQHGGPFILLLSVLGKTFVQPLLKCNPSLTVCSLLAKFPIKSVQSYPPYCFNI